MYRGIKNTYVPLIGKVCEVIFWSWQNFPSLPYALDNLAVKKVCTSCVVLLYIYIDKAAFPSLKNFKTSWPCDGNVLYWAVEKSRDTGQSLYFFGQCTDMSQLAKKLFLFRRQISTSLSLMRSEIMERKAKCCLYRNSQTVTDTA